VLYAVARSGPDITELVLQDSAALAKCGENGQPCESDDPSLRDLSLIPSKQIKSSAFLPSGTDVRGFLLSPDKKQAYVLHRNTPEFSNSTNPAALVVLDRRPGPNGTNMQFHDSGRGNLLYITCFEGGQINVVDPQDPRVVAVIETGRGPLALTFSPADKTVAFVASYAENNVSVIDLQPGSPTEYMMVQRLGFPHLVTK
jgi:DNA-binding beta-propeller fold protein YncE